MSRLGILAALVLSLAASCASGGVPIATGVTCTEPPEAEVARVSPVALTLEPNPVAPGQVARLSMSSEGLPDDAITGAGAAWQCWDGSKWVDTHQILKGERNGTFYTREVEPGVTTTVEAIGYTVPNSFPILIPEVAPGIYRLHDEAYSSATPIPGFVIVRVVGE